MNLEAPYKIGVKRHVAGATDAHGNTVESWASTIFVGVYSVAPASSNEPFDSGRNAVVTGLTVLAPAGTEIGPRDKVIWNNEEYKVEGDIADWNHGPFGFTPGVQINLERVEG